MLATPLFNKCTLHTPPLSYSCAYSICATRHPCPLSSPSSCCSLAHCCTHSRRCSVWSSRCCVAVSVSFSGSSLSRNHGAATKDEDDEAAKHYMALLCRGVSEIIQLFSKVIQRKSVNNINYDNLTI